MNESSSRSLGFHDNRIKNPEAISAKNGLSAYLSGLRARHVKHDYSCLPNPLDWKVLAEKVRAVLAAIGKPSTRTTALLAWQEVKAIDLRYPSVKLGAYCRGLVSMLERDAGPFINLRRTLVGKLNNSSSDDRIRALIEYVPFKPIRYEELNPREWARLRALIEPEMMTEPFRVLGHYVPKLSHVAQNDIAPLLGWFALQQIQVEDLFWHRKNGDAFSRILLYLYALRCDEIDQRLQVLALTTPELSGDLSPVRSASPEEARRSRKRMLGRLRQANFREKNAGENVTQRSEHSS